MKYKIIGVFLPFLLLFLSSCSMLGLKEETISGVPDHMLIIIEKNIYDDISSEVNQYRNDIFSEGTAAEIYLWEEGSYLDLRDTITEYMGIVDTVFLIGELPAAWYEQTSFGDSESFPCDLYFMCPESVWSDSNNNGIFDTHSPLTVDISLSRINGSDTELKSYFNKLHKYRTGGFTNTGSAFIFKDDDWFNNYRGSTFGLDKLYRNISVHDSKDTTVRAQYVETLQTETVDYVYQWIHALPSSLYIINGNKYEQITVNDIGPHTNALFYNMFNCSAARFTEINLAMTYLMKTDTGLGVIGSTKVGGNYYPLEFHRSLALGSCWGNAFKSWYNRYGSGDDQWFLGMVILGDPVLKLSVTSSPKGISTKSLTAVFPPDSTEKELLYRKFMEFKETNQEVR